MDLDATVVMMNETGGVIDAVYYNQIQSECGSIIHSGDQRDGTQDGFDEFITIDTSKINFSTCYLPILINSFKGTGFNNVETATVTFLTNNERLFDIQLGGIRSENSACLACFIYRKDGGWSVYNCQMAGPGKVFTECEQLIEDNLKFVGLDPIVMAESR